MKKLIILALILAVTTSLAFAAAGNSSAEGVKPTRTLENVHLGNQAVRQEFVWDEEAGVFKTVNLYTIGEVEDHIADVNDVLSQGAKGDGDIVGDADTYTYWDGSGWVTLENITRYEGSDDRAEAFITRYDETFYTQSTTFWEAITGTQTLYSKYVYSRVVRRDPHYYTYYYTNYYSTGERALTGTFSKVTNVPAAYDPVVEVTLANGWNVTINSHYTVWGNEVKITSPTGQVSYVYGDPHLLQAGGTQQQELAAIGNYVFDLGGYTMDLSCMQSNAGFSLVTDLSITGPNGYTMTYGRNNEVKVSGGTGATGVQ